MDNMNNFLDFGPLAFLSADVQRSCIILGVFIFSAFVIYGFMRFNTIDDLEEHRRKDKKVKGNKKTDGEQADAFETAIMSLLSVDDNKTKNQIKLNELTKRRLPLNIRFKKMLNNLIHNPYNTTSVPRLIMISSISGGIGLTLGIVLANPAALVIFTVMGFAVPIILVSLKVLRKQLSVMEGNLGLMSNHLGVYKESSSLIESFKTLLTILTPGSREYKAISTAVTARTEAKITMDVVLRDLLNDLLADINVKQYFDVCYIADTVSADYKESLDYLPVRFHPIVIKNITYVAACFYAYILYMGISLGVIGMMVYYRFFSKEIYGFLTGTTFGQVGCLVLMTALLLFGFGIAMIAKVIRLDVGMEGEQK